jgi:hypothetical protein
MTSTVLIESPEHLQDSDEPLLAGQSPLRVRVPVAGPPVWVGMGFGVALLLLLVPPLTLAATLMAVALVAVAAVVALVVLAGAILATPFVIVRQLRGHRLPHFSLPVPHFGDAKVRRV